MAIKNYRQSGFDHYLHRTRKVAEPSDMASLVDTSAEFSLGGFSGQNIAPLTVDTNQMNTDAITNPKMADDSVDTAEVVDGAITQAKQSIGFSPNLVPECYAGFECKNNGDDVGTIDGGGPTGFYDVASITSTGIESFSVHHRKLARAPDKTWWVVYGKDGAGVFASFSTDDGETWTEETVFSTADNLGDCAIAVDSSNVPHVLFNLPSGPNIRHGERTGVGTWTTESIKAAALQVIMGSIEIDSNDDIHVVYGYVVIAGPYYNYSIGYNKYTGGAWAGEEVVHIETASGQSFEQINPRIAIDSNDVPHVVWVGETDHGTHPLQDIIRYSNRVGGSWVAVEAVQDVDTGEASDWAWWNPDIAIGTDGYPYVIYSNADVHASGDAYDLKFTHRESVEADWASNRETVASGGARYQSSALTINASNVPHVLFEIADTDIYHTYRESAEADWASNDTNITDGAYSDPGPVCTLGSVNPSGNQFSSGYAFAFFESAAQDKIVFCSGGPQYSTAQCSTADRYEGEKSLLLNLAEGNDWYAGSSVINYNARVRAETKYVVSAYIKAVSGTVTVNLRVKQDDATVTDVVTGQTVGDTWTRIYGNFTTLAGVAEVLARIDGDGNYYVDAAMLEEASDDGDPPEPSDFKAPSLITRTLDDCSDVTIS